MAEEVQINNVGGEGVASEVTLANLLAVTEQMAKKAGVDPKDVTKKLKALSTATTDTIKVSTKNRDSLKKNTKAVDESTSAYKKLGGVVGGAVISSLSALARSGTEITKAFINGSTRLDAFTSHLPIVGTQLGLLAGLFDDSFEAFQNVATSGASFNNSMTDLRNAAANAMMPLNEFTSLIVANSEKLAAFGGTATQGAQQIVKLNKALGTNRTDLLNMGLNFQEINEALIDYQYLTRAGSRTERRQQQSAEQQAAAAAGYTKNLLILGKLTGQDVKSQQEKIAVAQMDIAMQKKLATLTEDERDKFNLLMADAQAAGPDAVRALQQQFLGMPPLTEGMQLYQSQFGEAFNVFGQGLDAVYDKNVETADFEQQSLNRQLSVMQGMDAAAARLGTLLEVGMLSGEGIPGMLSEIYANSGLKMDTYLDERGRLDVAAAQAGMDAAAAEAAARAAETETMSEFMATIGRANSAFQTSIVTPLMKAVTPALNALVTALRGPVDEDGNPIEGAQTGFESAITTISDYINNILAPAILSFIDTVKTDGFKEAIIDMFTRGTAYLTDVIADFFLGANTKTIMTPDGEKEVETERKDGFLQTTLQPMFDAVGPIIWDGFTQAMGYIKDKAVDFFKDSSGWVQAMIIGAGVLFAGGGPLALAMAAGATRMMARGARAMVMPRTPTPGATPPRTGPTVGRGPDGRFTRLPDAPDAGGSRLGRAARFGGRLLSKAALPLAAGMSLYDGFQGFNADPNAGFLESAGNAGSSVLNGLTFGLLGRSSSEIAADAEAQGSATTPDVPTIDSPGAQLAMILSTEQVSAMERIAAVNLSTFNSGLRELLQIDLRSFYRFVEIDWQAAASGISTLASTNTLPLAQLAVLDLSTFATGVTSLADVSTRALSRFAAIDFTTVATGISELASTNIANLTQLAVLDLSTFATGITSLADISTRELSNFAAIDFTTVATGLDAFAKIPDLQTNFNTINSLDAAPVRTYTEAMENLVEVLGKVNEELSKDNNGLGFGTGTNAGDLLGQIGSATSGTSQGTEQLNNTMQQVLLLLREMRDLDVDVERNTRNIIGSNLAQGGVSNVSK